MSEISKKILLDEELKKQYEITIKSSFINSQIDKEAEIKQKTYKINGFRPGKVPLNVIKTREGNVLYLNISEKTINKEIFDMVDNEKLELSSDPKVEIKQMKVNEDIIFNVVYNLLPNIPEINLKDIKIDNYNIRVTEQEINESINKILNNFKKFNKIDQSASIGDAVKINFIGTIDGEEFPGGKSENYQLELGSHSFIDNFEEQLVGRKAGDKILVKVKFPFDYHSSKLANKNAEFNVEILEVLESQKEELTDEFCLKNFGVDDVIKFRDLVEQELKKSYDQASKNKIKNILFDKIYNIYNFSVPSDLIEEQFKITLQNKEKDNLNKKIEKKIDENAIRIEAEKTIKISLILSDIGKKANIQVSDNDISNAIMKNAMQMKGHEKMFIDFYRNNSKALESLKLQTLEEKIIDYLIENISKNNIDITLEEFENLSKKN